MGCVSVWVLCRGGVSGALRSWEVGAVMCGDLCEVLPDRSGVDLFYPFGVHLFVLCRVVKLPGQGPIRSLCLIVAAGLGGLSGRAFSCVGTSRSDCLTVPIHKVSHSSPGRNRQS